MTTLNQYLQNIIKTEPHSIGVEVATEALEYHDLEAFFDDLLKHGCISGMISGLIYYTDTHAFFDRNYDEIEQMRFDYLENNGISILEFVQGDLKNDLAWLTFEETARAMKHNFDAEC